ncbi:MAG: Wzz/FepE/Etk N-terminal domain-containing protein [Thermoleophilia bacterium]
MSADAESHPDLEAEREVDLGRVWRSLLTRWWLILAAIVVGVVVGYLVSLGSGNVFQAKATIYLGQPLSAAGSAQLQSYQNNPSTVNQLARDPGLVQEVAQQVDVLPGKLRAGISTKSVAGASTRTGQTPLVEIIVRGSFRQKGADAANLIAQSVVAQVSSLSAAKIATLERLQESQQRSLASIEQTLTAIQEAQADPSLSSTDKLVLSTQALTADSRRAQIEDDLAQTEQNLNVAREVEAGKVLREAVSSKVAARSKTSGMVVGGIVGLVVGGILALAWPRLVGGLRRRRAA